MGSTWKYCNFLIGLAPGGLSGSEVVAARAAALDQRAAAGRAARRPSLTTIPTTPTPPPLSIEPSNNLSHTRMHQSKKRKSSVSSVSHPFDGPPSPAPSAASSSAASSSQLPQASGATEGSSSSGGRAGSAAPSASHGSGGHPTVGGGVGELIGTGTGPGDVNEPGISLCVAAPARPLTRALARARSLTSCSRC